MGTRTGSRKTGLMDRLRRLRSSSIPFNKTLQPDDMTTASSTAEKPPPYPSSQQKPPTSGNRDAKSSWMSKPKRASSKNHQGDQNLDLEKLDSKLEQWARERRLEEEEDDELATRPPQFDQMNDNVRAEEQANDNILEAQSNDDQPVTMETKLNDDDEAGGKSPEDPAQQQELEAALGPQDPRSVPGNDVHPQPPQQQTHECISAVAHTVHEPIESTQQQRQQPSDFDVFLQQAEEEDRLRRERGGGLDSSDGRATTRHEQQLNQFYVSHSWTADQGRNGNTNALPPPGTKKSNKLTEIRELLEDQDDDDDDADSIHARAAAAAAVLAAATIGKGEPAPALEYYSSSDALSTATASTGSHDFADPITLQYTVTTQTNNTTSQRPPNRVGRHVSFTEPPTTIIPSSMMRERSASYPVAKHFGRGATGQVRFESPRGSGRRRRQFGGRKKGIGRIFAGFGRQGGA